MGQWILAANGQPFNDRDAASVRRDLLAPELGSAFTVEVAEHPEGGFVVDCTRKTECPNPAGEAESAVTADRVAFSQEGSDPNAPIPLLRARAVGRLPLFDERLSRSRALTRLEVARGSTDPADHHNAEVSGDAAASLLAAEPPPVPKAENVGARPHLRLRRSPRAFLGQYVCMGLGVYTFLAPETALSLCRLQLPTHPVLASVLFGVVSAAGFFLAVLAGVRVLWGYTTTTYTLDEGGVTHSAWRAEGGAIHRESAHLDFSQVRSVVVRRSLTQTLLSIGDIRLASALPGLRDIILRDVREPNHLKAVLQHEVGSVYKLADRSSGKDVDRPVARDAAGKVS
jgi:hypothetical protein